MFNKKFVILITLLISLLAVSSVSAADNDTFDIVGVDNSTDEIVSVNDDNPVIESVDEDIGCLNVNYIDNQTAGIEDKKDSGVYGTTGLEFNIPSLVVDSDVENVTFQFPNDAKGTVTFSVNGNDYDFGVANGIVNITLPKLPSGIYIYTISYSGDSIYSSFSKNGTLTVNNASGNNSQSNPTIDLHIDISSLEVPSNGGKVVFHFPNEATGTVTLNVLGKNYVADVIDGVVNLNLPLLQDGVYDYVLTYSGDSKYSSFVRTGKINYNMTAGNNSGTNNKTIRFDVNVPSLDVVTDNHTVTILFPSDSTGTLTLTVDGNNHVFNVVNGIVNLKLPNLPNGIYDYTLTYSGDNKYSSFEKTGIMKVNKTSESASGSDKPAKFDIEVPLLNVTSDGGNVTFVFPSDAAGTVTLSVNGRNYDFGVMNSAVNIALPVLENGVYNYTISYSGDSKYASFVKTGIMYVNKSSGQGSSVKPLDGDINVPSLDVTSGNRVVAIDFPSDAAGNVTLAIGGKNYVFDIINGVANVEVPKLPNGQYNYTISYSGDGKYSPFAKNGSLKINTTSDVPGGNATIDPEISIPSLDELSNDRSVKITLPSDAKGTVTLTINGAIYPFNVINGVANVEIPELDNGNYNYTISYSGDGKYSSFSKKGSMNVNNTSEAHDNNSTDDSQITIPPLDEMSSGGSATISLPKDATGNVSLEINGKVYTFPVEDGGADVKIPDLTSGNYNYTIRYSGDKRHPSFSSNGVMVINNPVGALPMPDVSMPYLNDDLDKGYAIVTVPEDGGGKVVLSISGKDYTFEVKDGKANITLPDLADGKYDYSITYYPESKYADLTGLGSLTVNKTEGSSSSKPTINIVPPSFGKIFSGESVAVAFPSDASGKLTLTINGKNYDYQVKNGVVNIVVPNFDGESSSYKITYSGDGKYSPFTTSGKLEKSPKVSPTISASNATVTYKADSYYTIKVYVAKGVLADGAAVKISGKISKTLKTTKSVAKFKVTQVPGKYKITITSLGKSITRTITVKHLVTLKTVTVKKSAKKLVLQAKLGKIKGKYLKNKKITFKFNGKKYTAKTNSKGVAKVTIKSSVLKKLKVGKKVTYQATYVKDTVKKTVKVKK